VQDNKLVYFCFFTLPLLLLLLTHKAHADKLPLSLMADQVSFDQKQGVGHYVGNVALDQGGNHLRSNKASSKTDAKHQLSLATAYGNEKNPAHFWRTETKKAPLHAYANLIHYYPAEKKIVLIGNVKVKQGLNQFAAAKLTYYLETAKIVASKSGDSRPTIVLYQTAKS